MVKINNEDENQWIVSTAVGMSLQQELCLFVCLMVF